MADAVKNANALTGEQQNELDTVVSKARDTLAIIETYDQEGVDRLYQAVVWAVSNKKVFIRLVHMGIEESLLGDLVSCRASA